MKSLLLLIIFLFYLFGLICGGGLTLNEYSLEWTEKEDKTDFKFSTIIEDSVNIWTSFALSLDQRMGNDNAFICKKYASEQKIEHAFNSGPMRPKLLSEENPSIGLSNPSFELNDKKFTCYFSRQNFLSNVDNYFNTNISYFILFARGKTDNVGVIGYHFANKTSSSEAFSLNLNKDIIETTSLTSQKTTTRQNEVTSSTTSESVTTKVNQNFEYSVNKFTLKWESYDDKIRFFFLTKNVTKQSNFYSAFAFSKDSFMGDDDVIACKITTNSNFLVERHYNKGKSSPYLIDTNKNIGISETNVLLADGTLNCSIMIDKSNLDVNNYSDLNKKWYILFAFGDLGSSTSLTTHSIREQGFEQIDFTSRIQETTTHSFTSTKPLGPITASGSFSYKGYSLSWQNTEDFTIFTGGKENVGSRSKRQSGSTNSYIAFGLSQDKLMVS